MHRTKTKSCETRHKHSSPISRILSYKLIIIVNILITLTLITLVHAQDAPIINNPQDDDIDDDADEWDEYKRGHGTTHEEMGQAHFPVVEYTEYKSTLKYSDTPNFPTYHLQPIFNFTHFIYDNLLTNEPAIPYGYIVVKNSDTLVLGPKVEQNNWRDLLIDYWWLIIWIVLWLIFIIIIPFIAVCYCCFCCCRRCPVGCPPCTYNRDARRRIIYGLLLLLFIISLGLGLLVAFFSNRLMDHGLEDSTTMARRRNKDICSFLKDVNEHIHHLFGHNYEELLTHLTFLLTSKYPHNHIMVDLDDTSQATAVEELLRILENMPEALKLMKEVNDQEKDLRFLTAQLRDGLRGVKREVQLACQKTGWEIRCIRFFMHTAIDRLDTSPCLHLDQVPDTDVYVKSIADIIDNQFVLIVRRVLLRLQEVSDKIEKAIEKVAPPIIRDLQRGRDKLLHQSAKITSIIDGAMTEVHLNSLRSTKSFEDVYEKFGTGRAIITVLVCVFLLVILLLLIIALICGCIGTKSTASRLLCLAIMVIFSTFSFIALVGLLYFMIGMVTFQGACAPIEADHSSHIFHQLDTILLMNDYYTAGSSAYPSKLLTAIKNCQSDETILQLIIDNNLYNIAQVDNMTILSDDELQSFDVTDVFLHVKLLLKDEHKDLTSMDDGNISTYHKSLYFEHICNKLTNYPLFALSARIRKLSDDLYSLRGGYHETRMSLYTSANHLDEYKRQWADKILVIQASMKDKLNKLNDLILYNNRDFADSINTLISTIVRSEKFLQSKGKDFIGSVMANLTDIVRDQANSYLDMVVEESTKNVGKCEPLSYIYYRSVDLVCSRIIDPINGFWVGALLCAFLLLPLLFVAHLLMCLYKTFMPITTDRAPIIDGCPICTGAPYTPPPVYVSSGDQQPYDSQRGAGGTAGDYIMIEPFSCNEFTKEEIVQLFNKRKQD